MTQAVELSTAFSFSVAARLGYFAFHADVPRMRQTARLENVGWS